MPQADILKQDIYFLVDVLADKFPRAQADSMRSRFLTAAQRGDLDGRFAALVALLYEDARYGLHNFRIVNHDRQLSAICAEIVSLASREIRGEQVTDQIRDLHSRINAAWSVAGEKKRLQTMAFARKWAWLGARKWAWIPTRPWSSTWTWALAATRPRSRAQSALMVAAWTSAWKWHKIWKCPRGLFDWVFERILRDLECAHAAPQLP